MEPELEYENYRSLEKCQPVTVEQNSQAEFVVPEYMPEIIRIIKSDACARIESCRTVGNRVTVDGICEMRTVYTADDGGIYTLTQTENFTRHCESTLFDGACDVTAKISVNYVNCRATATRRADIKASLLISLTAWRAKEISTVCSGSCSSLEEKCVPVVTSSLGCRKTHRFSMSDTVSFAAPAAFIISSRACAVCGETRKINNKIMIKGEAIVEVVYVPAGDKTAAERFKHTLPVNQIIEFEGMEERYTGDVALKCTACEVMLRSDGDGICRSADIALGVDASVTMWETKETAVISDAYSVNSSVDLKKERCSFLSPVCELNETETVNSVVQIGGEGISEALDISAEVGEPAVKCENGELTVNGSLKLSMLIRDSKGSLSGYEKMVDFAIKKNVDGEFAAIWAAPAITVTSADWSVNSDSSLEVRIEMNVCGTVFSETSMEVVTGVNLCDAPRKRGKNAVTVYFPENEESLWDIARRYNTTVKAIAEENAIEGDSTCDLKILFIPAV